MSDQRFFYKKPNKGPTSKSFLNSKAIVLEKVS